MTCDRSRPAIAKSRSTLRAELRDLAVHEQPRVEAVLGDSFPAGARRLERPGLAEIRLVFLQQEAHPQVVRRQHPERIAHECDEACVRVEAPYPFEGIGQVEVRHRALAQSLVFRRAVAETAFEVVPPEFVRGRVLAQPGEVVGLLRPREADLRVAREIAAERRRAAAGRAHHEEIREAGSLCHPWVPEPPARRLVRPWSGKARAIPIAPWLTRHSTRPGRSAAPLLPPRPGPRASPSRRRFPLAALRRRPRSDADTVAAALR